MTHAARKIQTDQHSGLVASAIELMKAYGPVKEVISIADAPRSGHHVYLVSNGEGILQIGKGRGRRMLGVMRGGLAVKHAKALVCALAETAYGVPNQYYYLSCKTEMESDRIESEVLSSLGIGRNRLAATLLPDFQNGCPGSLEAVTLHLWGLIQEQPIWSTLSPGEKDLAAELVQFISRGSHKMRNGKPVTRGDLLEGNTMVAAGKAHLIPVFLKLTNHYLRYGKKVMKASQLPANVIYLPVGAARPEKKPGLPIDPAPPPISMAVPGPGDVTISRAAIEQAIELVTRRPEWIGKKFHFKTSEAEVRFEVEDVRKSQLQDILSTFPAQGDRLVVQDSGQTNRQAGKPQFRTQKGSGYLVVIGAWGDGPNFID
jgi:hypothetical protein